MEVMQEVEQGKNVNRRHAGSPASVRSSHSYELHSRRAAKSRSVSIDEKMSSLGAGEDVMRRRRLRTSRSDTDGTWRNVVGDSFQKGEPHSSHGLVISRSGMSVKSKEASNMLSQIETDRPQMDPQAVGVKKKIQSSSGGVGNKNSCASAKSLEHKQWRSDIRHGNVVVAKTQSSKQKKL